MIDAFGFPIWKLCVQQLLWLLILRGKGKVRAWNS